MRGRAWRSDPKPVDVLKAKRGICVSDLQGPLLQVVGGAKYASR